MVHSMLSCCGVMMLYMLYIVSFSDANIFVPQVFALCTFFQVHSFYLLTSISLYIEAVDHYSLY